MKHITVFTQAAILAFLFCFSGPGSAQAGLITVDMGKTLQETQTDAAGDMSLDGYYFAARAFYQNTGDYDSASLTWPGPASPGSMNNVPGTYMFLGGGTAAGYFIYQSGFYSTQAAMDADFPFGSYEYDLNDSTNTNPPASSTIDYTSDLYPANQPTLTAGSFNALQGLNAADAVTISFASLEDNPGFGGSDQDFAFLTVDTAGFGSEVYSTFSASPTTLTSFTIPADTLTAGESYSLLLNFDNRTTGLDGNGVNQFQLFDTSTEVDFTTAAQVVTPEPAAFGLSASGLLMLAWLRKRAR